MSSFWGDSGFAENETRDIGGPCCQLECHRPDWTPSTKIWRGRRNISLRTGKDSDLQDYLRVGVGRFLGHLACGTDDPSSSVKLSFFCGRFQIGITICILLNCGSKTHLDIGIGISLTEAWLIIQCNYSLRSLFVCVWGFGAENSNNWAGGMLNRGRERSIEKQVCSCEWAMGTFVLLWGK